MKDHLINWQLSSLKFPGDPGLKILGKESGVCISRTWIDPTVCVVVFHGVCVASLYARNGALFNPD